MVSSLGTGMSGITLNDREPTVQAKKFTSYGDQYENTFDDWEITGSGKYDLEKDEFDDEK